MRGAEQVERCSLTTLIGRCLEERQRLLMVGLHRDGLLTIGIPVGHAVQAVRDHGRIADRARQMKRLMEVLTGSRIVTSDPQKAQIDDTLPFRSAVACGTCSRLSLQI